MNASHAELKEQAGAYVLGSLDPDEQISFEAHLAGCEECAAEGCGAVDTDDLDACGECSDCNGRG